MDTREKLVELLRKAPHLDVVKGYKGNNYTFEQGADWLIAHGVTVQEWISVEERLPEKNGTYLVYKAKINVREVLGFVKDGIEVDEEDLIGLKNIWYDYDSEWGYYSVNTVTHWMPLPKPPKGE